MLFQLGSSVVSVWVICMPPSPPPPNGKVGIRVAEKFGIFIFMFNKFQPKDNSVQSLLHLLAIICDEQCTNWFTLHFYNLYQNLQKCKYLSGIPMVLHKTFRTGLVFLSWSKWVQGVVCYDQNLQKCKYLSRISMVLHQTFRTGLIFPSWLRWV